MADLDFLIRGRKQPVRPAAVGEKMSISEILQGQFASVDSQQVFVRTLPADGEHVPGLSVEISACRLEPLILQWAGASQPTSLEKLLFIDTETTGLAGGTGTYAFLVGLGYFESDRFVVQQFFMNSPTGEKELMSELARRLADFDILVSFNGKSYDIPLLDNRFIYHHSEFQIKSMDHLDLLPLSRRLWKNTLPGCALQQLEAHVLQTGRDGTADIPGRDIPQLYFDFLKSGNATPLRNVFYHNVIDIISMAILLDQISKVIDTPVETFQEMKVELAGVARFCRDMGLEDRAVSLLHHCVKHQLDLRSNRKDLSFLLKRHGDWQEASQLWLAAAEDQETYALVELAKLAEHRLKELREALDWTHKAIELQADRDKSILAELHHRRLRLERKINLS